MKWFCLILAAMGLCACAAVPQDRLTAEERADCIRAENPSSGLIMISPYGVGCLEYGPAKRMSGVWYFGFEESGFIPGVRRVPLVRDLKDNDNPEFDAHLTFNDEAEIAKVDLPERKAGCVRAVHLEFVGRKAIRRYPGPMSSEVDVIRVDEVLRSKFVGYVNTMRAGKPYMTCK